MAKEPNLAPSRRGIPKGESGKCFESTGLTLKDAVNAAKPQTAVKPPPPPPPPPKNEVTSPKDRLLTARGMSQHTAGQCRR